MWTPWWESFGGLVPGDFLNFGFDLLKPMNKMRKYYGFNDVAKNKSSLMNFLRMEKWVSDSPAQAGENLPQIHIMTSTSRTSWPKEPSNWEERLLI